MKKCLKVLPLAALVCASSLVQAETIDIGILYTDAAVSKTGNNIDTKINQLISFSNQVYRQNNIDITLRLVGKENLGNYAITPSEGWINAVTDSSWVSTMRNDWNADMVAVLGTGESSGGLTSCGIAWVGQGSNGSLDYSFRDKMYSITAVDCGATTFVHELGHNQGLTHSRKQGDTSGGVYKDGMGHGVQNKFTSIMAYPHVFGSATQYDYFSNPAWSVSGEAYGVTGESYAWKTVNATKKSIANFK